MAMKERDPFGKVVARTYNPNSEQAAKVAELHLGFKAVAQVSALPDEDGFLIRVWPPNGTAEYGGTNLTCMSAVIRFGPDMKPIIEKIDAHAGER